MDKGTSNILSWSLPLPDLSDQAVLFILNVFLTTVIIFLLFKKEFTILTEWNLLVAIYSL